uniref:Putative serine/threonine protein kinase plk3 n=1 Tax=Ixodes ricinus TaxID=34613 RepID=A0A0K8RAK2_IXORI
MVGLSLAFRRRHRFRTSRRLGSATGGNRMAKFGLMMARSLSFRATMCWKGARPYAIVYRMHPRDQMSDRRLILSPQSPVPFPGILAMDSGDMKFRVPIWKERCRLLAYTPVRRASRMTFTPNDIQCKCHLGSVTRELK